MPREFVAWHLRDDASARDRILVPTDPHHTLFEHPLELWNPAWWADFTTPYADFGGRPLIYASYAPAHDPSAGFERLIGDN